MAFFRCFQGEFSDSNSNVIEDIVPASSNPSSLVIDTDTAPDILIVYKEEQGVPTMFLAWEYEVMTRYSTYRKENIIGLKSYNSVPYLSEIFGNANTGMPYAYIDFAEQTQSYTRFTLWGVSASTGSEWKYIAIYKNNEGE